MKLVYFIPVLIILLIILIDQLVRRHAYRRLEKMYAQGEYDEILDYLDTRYPRLLFPLFNRRNARFKALEAKGDTKAAYEELQLILAMELKDKQRNEVLLNSFQFYLKNGYYQDAKKTIERIDAAPGMGRLVPELSKLYEIMAEQSYEYIDEMEAQLEGADDATAQRLRYLLKVQYENKEGKRAKRGGKSSR